MFDQIFHFLQGVASFMGGAVGLSMLFPKIGEAFLGRVFTGSIEQQKALYAHQLEAHKLTLSAQLEEHKKNLAIQIEAEKQGLTLYFADQKRQLDARQRFIEELRIGASEIISDSESDQDEKYRQVSMLLRRINIYPLQVRKIFRRNLDELSELIEAPLSLTTDSFCDDVDSLILKLIEQADSLG
jgi:hypothetical protein